MPAVASSNIQAIEHDGETDTLTVQFRSGGVYEYSGVSREVYEQFLGVGSKGAFLHRIIKPSYPATRVG
ncbi:MAG TPA: KTSC domain-containing protein [Phycisphaerae bacterium]|nr:KTSC domain-containing protein [Phycisphaerae bacterium]